MKPKQRSKNQNPNKQGLRGIAKTGAGLAAGAVVIWAAVSFANLQELDRHVAQIAAQFKCICPMNCNLTWGSCHCKEPGGASEGKDFIRQSLKRGLSESETTALANQKYGGLI